MTEAITADSQSAPVDSSVPSEAEGATTAPDPSPKPDPNVTANGEKLDRQTRNWRALETDRDHWREMAMRSATPAQAPPPAATSPDAATKTLADFEYDEAKYQKYVHERYEQSAESVVERKLREAQERETRNRRETSFKTRVTEFSKTVDDYDEVVRNPSLSITGEMAEAIKESDDGPALAYYLGKNPDVAERVASLSPFAAAREIGKIEARLASEREQAKSKAAVSKAPPPPPKVEGADPGNNVKADDPDSDKLSDAEWARLRNKQTLRKRK